LWRNRNGFGVGLAVLGLTSFFIFFHFFMNGTWTSRGHDNRLRNIIFFLGAESIALFARVGGGIY
jgi:Na+/H+-translocating membrane pyrophosphatase